MQLKDLFIREINRNNLIDKGALKMPLFAIKLINENENVFNYAYAQFEQAELVPSWDNYRELNSKDKDNVRQLYIDYQNRLNGYYDRLHGDNESELPTLDNPDYFVPSIHSTLFFKVVLDIENEINILQKNFERNFETSKIYCEYHAFNIVEKLLLIDNESVIKALLNYLIENNINIFILKDKNDTQKWLVYKVEFNIYLKKTFENKVRELVSKSVIPVSNYVDAALEDDVITKTVDPIRSTQFINYKVFNNVENHVYSRAGEIMKGLAEYGFLDLKYVKGIEEERRLNILVKDFNEASVPYLIALFSELGFIKLLDTDYFFRNVEGRNSFLSRILDKVDKRTIKGNVNVLKNGSTEDPHRYTSHKFVKEIKEKYKIGV